MGFTRPDHAIFTAFTLRTGHQFQVDQRDVERRRVKRLQRQALATAGRHYFPLHGFNRFAGCTRQPGRPIKQFDPRTKSHLQGVHILGAVGLGWNFQYVEPEHRLLVLCQPCTHRWQPAGEHHAQALALARINPRHWRRKHKWRLRARGGGLNAAGVDPGLNQRRQIAVVIEFDGDFFLARRVHQTGTGDHHTGHGLRPYQQHQARQ